MSLPAGDNKVHSGDAIQLATEWWRPLVDARLALVLILFFAVALSSLNDSTLYTPDTPRYLIWAQSLGALHGFEDTSGPQGLRYVIHAPLYPVLLAPLTWLFDTIVMPAKALTVLFGGVLIAAFFFWLRSMGNAWTAFVGSLLLALNPLIILLSSHVLSDIPFALVVVLFLLLTRQMVNESTHDRWPLKLIAVLTAAMFLREIGLTLLLSVGAYLVLKKEFRRVLITVTIPILFYLLWFYRNEIYVALIENPPLRNSKVFLGHMFTGDDASLFDEFIARLRVNAVVYFRMMKGLLLFPQYLVQPFGVVVTSEQTIAATAKALRYAQYPLAALQYGLVIWGIVTRRGEGRWFRLIGIFVLFYLGMILLYPISDVRFLIPLLLLFLAFAALGGADLYSRLYRSAVPKSLIIGVTCAMLALTSIPNIVWLMNYHSASSTYQRNTRELAIPYFADSSTPEVYARPASLLGSWMAGHSDSLATVMARWKELTFWLGGRKIVDTDPLISLSRFEQLLRDHKIRYLVSAASSPGIREFELQMSLSSRFQFATVYRAGNCEVVEVTMAAHDPGLRTSALDLDSGVADSLGMKDLEIRKSFLRGIRELKEGSSQEAIQTFGALLQESSGSGYVGLMLGIAYEFGGMYEEGLRLFDGFRYRPQAGPYVLHAQYHSGLIRDLQDADRDTAADTKARAYFRVSAGCWDLGFHVQALRLLNKSLRADSVFAPALVFGIHYSLQSGDTVEARRFFDRLLSAYPRHRIAPAIQALFATLDSLNVTRTTSARLGMRLNIAAAYLQLGLNDVALDEAAAILDVDPSNRNALRVAARAYEATDRVWLAAQALERLITLQPDAADAKEKLAELRSRLW